jgi:hypothetical protein
MLANIMLYDILTFALAVCLATITLTLLVILR